MFKFEEAFGVLGHYIGYKTHVRHMWKYLAKKDRMHCNHVDFPDFLSDDDEAYDRILWSTLVIMYGSYGVSPRKGWIVNPHDAKKFVKNILDWM